MPAFLHRVLLACVLLGALAGAGLAQAAPEATVIATPMPLSAPDANSTPDAVHRPVDSVWWREGVTVFAALWDDARARLTDDAPDWLHRLSQRQPAAALPLVDAAYVVLQDDRADGMDLVTLRYRLAEQGPLRAYAGAGVNHARYFADGIEAGPSLLTRRNRHTGVGPAAELGAEYAFSDQVRLNADLRWVELDERADLLYGSYGPVAADPVTLGIRLGYRFR